MEIEQAIAVLDDKKVLSVTRAFLQDFKYTAHCANDVFKDKAAQTNSEVTFELSESGIYIRATFIHSNIKYIALFTREEVKKVFGVKKIKGIEE